ncbi:MAG: hypothetical protein K8U03_09255 [Planctomycetia bacterium]|nr:hypothetical protein [Planctomycetia bacterium]
MGYGLKDALLKVTKVLPNGAASTTSDAIDLGLSSKGDFVAPVEFKLTAPALGVTPLADAKTMKYSIVHSDNSDLSSPSTLMTDVIVQTGAGGIGAVTASATVRLPVDVKRYIGCKATGSTTGDASASSMTLEALL